MENPGFNAIHNTKKSNKGKNKVIIALNSVSVELFGWQNNAPEVTKRKDIS